MPLAGNLTTISITEDWLRARFPALDRFRPPEQADFSAQIAAGRTDALDAFHAARGVDPARTVPVRPDSWKRILTYFTLTVVFRGMPGDEWEGEADKWSQKAEAALGAFVFQVDVDEDDAVDEDSDQRLREVMLAR